MCCMRLQETEPWRERAKTFEPGYLRIRKAVGGLARTLRKIPFYPISGQERRPK